MEPVGGDGYLLKRGSAGIGLQQRSKLDEHGSLGPVQLDGSIAVLNDICVKRVNRGDSTMCGVLPVTCVGAGLQAAVGHRSVDHRLVLRDAGHLEEHPKPLCAAIRLGLVVVVLGGLPEGWSVNGQA